MALPARLLTADARLPRYSELVWLEAVSRGNVSFTVTPLHLRSLQIAVVMALSKDMHIVVCTPCFGGLVTQGYMLSTTNLLLLGSQAGW